jgi:hypothetical protein
MVRIFLLVALLLPCCFLVRAQVTVKGKLVDDKNNSGIGFSTVALLSASDSTGITTKMTDSTGFFELTGLPHGKFLLLFSSVGYQSLYREIQPGTPLQSIVDLGHIIMTADPKFLNAVIVNGGQPAFQRETGKLIVTIAGNKYFKTAANAVDVLKRLPGLEVAGDGTLLLSGRINPAIFIDGKLVPMSPEELQIYLNTLSPEGIAAIEVINNPSSQYDGEHKGIINIKLKPDLTIGWKGIVSTNIQRNDYTLAENNFLLTYKTKKVVYTARLTYTTGTTIRTYKALQHQANTNIMATNTRILTGNNNYSYQLGLDYNFKKDQRIEVLLRAFQSNRTLNSYNTLYATDSSAKQVVFNRNSNNDADPTQTNYGANVNYIGRFGKNQFQVLTSIASIDTRQQEDIQNKNVINDQLQEYWKTRMKNDILFRTLQADLSRELPTGRYDTLNTANLFVIDSNRTNAFNYDEYITAGYIAYERKLNKFNLSAGLRAEQTHSRAYAVTLDQTTDRNYIKWLPSLNITYALPKNQQLNFSFTRRITRPTLPHLNPFRFYFSPLNYWIGNPYLLPSTTSVLNASYTQKAFTVGINIGREKDPMTRYPEYNRTTNILEYLGRNLPYNDFAGIEISVPFIVSKWWRMNNNINGYYKKEQTPYHGVTYAIPITWITISGSQVFTLPKGFTLDATYYYRSSGGDGMYVEKSVSYIDLSLQRAWLKGKLNARVNYYDIFNTYRFSRTFRELDIINNRFTHWFGVQRIAMTLSYSFGRSTYKAKQAGRNEEETRAGM